MVFFAITRKGFESYLVLKNAAGALWLGANILSDDELVELRKSGINVSVFNYAIEPNEIGVIAEAIETIKEHHPEQPLWVEG